MTDTASLSAALDANGVRVLTIRQPWATLLVAPDLPKTIETRGKAWPSTIPLPAWVLINAAARRPELNGYIGDYIPNWGPDGYGLTGHGVHRWMPLGAVIGAAHVTHCLPIVHGWECPQGERHLAVRQFKAERWASGSGGYFLHLCDETVPNGWFDITADLPYGIYSPGRYGYLTDETVLFPEPIPWKGALGWQRVPASLYLNVRAALTKDGMP